MSPNIRVRFEADRESTMPGDRLPVGSGLVGRRVEGSLGEVKVARRSAREGGGREDRGVSAGRTDLSSSSDG